MASEMASRGGLAPPADAVTLPAPPAQTRGPHFPASGGCFGCGPGHPAGLVDEAIGMYVWSYGDSYATARLEVDYLLPVPLAVEVAIAMTSGKRHKSKIYIVAEARMTGKIAVRATALYVRINDSTGQDLNSHV